MDPFKLAGPLGQVAAKIAKAGKLDAAAVVTIHNYKVGMFFGSEKPMDDAMMCALLKATGEHCIKMSQDISSGKIKPTKLDEDTLCLNPKPEEPPDNPWEGN